MTEHPLTPAGSGSPPPMSSDAFSSERAYAGEPDWQSDDAEGTPIRDVVAALLRYKWMIVIAAVLGAGAAYVVWTKTQHEYLAQGSLWVQSDDADDRGPIVTSGLLRSAAWLDLLRSFAVLDPVVRQEKLYLSTRRTEDLSFFEDFVLGDSPVSGAYRLRGAESGGEIVLERDGEIVDRVHPGAPIGAELGFLWSLPEDGLPNDRAIEFNISTPRAAAIRLREELVSQMVPEGSFIRVEYRGRDPRRVAGVVNGVLEQHVSLAAELKSGNLNEQTEILAQQLRTVEEELADAERTLESFRVQTITLPSDDARPIQAGLEMTRDPVFADFFQLRVDQEQIRRDRQRLEAVVDALPETGVRVEAVEFIPSVSNSAPVQEALELLTASRAEYRAMLQVYTAEHPPARELSERIRSLEQDEIPALLRQLVNQLQEEENQLARRIEASGTEIAQIPPRAIEEARLRRRVAIAETLYTELRERFEESSLARASSIPDVRILDRAAVPDMPTNDQRARLAGMLFMGIFGMGVAGAILLGRMDPRLRTPDQIARAFGLTVLGTVPRIEQSRNKKVKKAINAPEVTEAFRGLRTNIVYAYGSAGPIVITISSSGPEEGKTTVSSNLARSFAELGRRVVIVDADTRRGDLHRVFRGLRKPGLTDLLRATASGEEVLQHADQPKLDFIGSGTQVANSPELLSSRRMGWLLTALKKRYDVILVDSPPLGAGADALVLSSLTSHLVLVVRSGETDREFTKAQIEPLSRLPVRILGVVLNDYAPDRLSGYRYYSSYLPGYEAGAEQAEEDRRLAAVRREEAAAEKERERAGDADADADADEADREGAAGAV